ncbi:MAG: sigma-70 family RNA polymerase sigma factor [Lachnospiraceae bacterium]|nr:sigma-70 family RNA polymerase sigma factor [Lachnospiraceae bacterium]
MSDTDDIKKWVQKAVAGDGTAFEELYRATCRSVFFTCFEFLKDQQETQDVVQDVYLTAYEQMSTLEDAGKFKPWLYRIAANKSMNILKKKQPLLPGDEQLQNMETEENENFLPEEYALHADKRELVLKIVQKTCSDVLYQTILLYYFNEFSIAEIAEIMGCLEGTVKYRLSTARAKIKEGVLQYEKKSGDKLYSMAAVPFLTAWFTARMQDMQMPSISLGFLGALPQSTLAASAAKTGGSMILKGLQLKIAAGIAAVVVAVGGITAAAVIIHNQNVQETSAEGQENGIPDAGNLGDITTLPESANGGGAANEETLPTESGTGNETDTNIDTEVTTDESEMPEETEPAETTPEPDAEKSQYTYTDMEATMYAKQTVNVRNQPSTDGAKVGSLSTNQEITITGQCNETGWYRFEYNGSTSYVSNNYVSDTKVEVAAAEQAANDTLSSSSSNLEGLEQYPVYTWLDYGDWFMYIAPDGQNHNYGNSEQVIIMMDAFDSRYPGQDYNGTWCFLKDGTFVQFFTIQDPWPQGYIDFMKKYYDPNFVPYR